MYYHEVRLSDKNALPEPAKTSTPRRLLAAYKTAAALARDPCRRHSWRSSRTETSFCYYTKPESRRLLDRKKSMMAAPKPSQAESALGRLAGGP